MTRNASGLNVARKGSKPGKKPASRKAIKGWDELGDIRYGLTPAGLELVAEMRSVQTVEERLAFMPEQLKGNLTNLPDLKLAEQITPEILLSRAQDAAKLSAIFPGLHLYYAPTAPGSWVEDDQRPAGIDGYVYMLTLTDDVLDGLQKAKVINGQGDVRKAVVAELQAVVDRVADLIAKVKAVELIA